MSASPFPSPMSLDEAVVRLRGMACHRPYKVSPPRPVWLPSVSGDTWPCIAIASQIAEGRNRHTCVIGVRPIGGLLDLACAMWSGDDALTGKTSAPAYQQAVTEAIGGIEHRIEVRRENLPLLGEQLRAGYGVFDRDVGGLPPKWKAREHLEAMAYLCERRMGGIDTVLRALAYEAADTLYITSRADSIKAMADRSLGFR